MSNQNKPKELTKTKLHKVLKKYRYEKERLEKEWEALCRRKVKTTDLGNGKFSQTQPTIGDHLKFNTKKANLFDQFMKEFEGYEVFPNNKNK